MSLFYSDIYFSLVSFFFVKRTFLFIWLAYCVLLWKYLSSTGRPHFLPHTQVPYLKSSGSTTREGVFLPNRAVGRSEIPGGASSSEVGIICSPQLEIGICQKLRGYIAAPPCPFSVYGPAISRGMAWKL